MLTFFVAVPFIIYLVIAPLVYLAAVGYAVMRKEDELDTFVGSIFVALLWPGLAIMLGEVLIKMHRNGAFVNTSDPTPDFNLRK